MNSHINVTRIDSYTAKQYNIKKYDEMVKFHQWLEVQTVRFDSAAQALQTYRGDAKPLETTDLVQTDKAPRYTERSFKSRQQLNNFLRRHGYTWHKIAPMSENEESHYGESFRWQLFSSDDRPLTVEQALTEIG